MQNEDPNGGGYWLGPESFSHQERLAEIEINLGFHSPSVWVIVNELRSTSTGRNQRRERLEDVCRVFREIVECARSRGATELIVGVTTASIPEHMREWTSGYMLHSRFRRDGFLMFRISERGPCWD